MENKKIKINDIEINYVKEGEGENLIFLHGWGQSLTNFDFFINELKKEKCVWAIDLPGFGDSDEPKTVFDIYEYEEVVAKFIDKLNIKNPTLIGHSFGGRISLIYAAKNKNINKLIITGGAGIKPSRSFGYYVKVYHYKYMKLLTKTPFYFQFKEDLLKSSGSSDYKDASPIMKGVLRVVVNEDLRYLMDKIEVKTLLYWGVNDDSTPIKDGHKMNHLIVDSDLIIKENSGHYAFLENKEDFLQKIREF